MCSMVRLTVLFMNCVLIVLSVVIVRFVATEQSQLAIIVSTEPQETIPVHTIQFRSVEVQTGRPDLVSE